MQHNYTRQRQGKDFSLPNYLRSAEKSVEGNCNSDGGVDGNAPQKDDAEAKKTLHDRLEHFKEEAERNAVPVDGAEPPMERDR